MIDQVLEGELRVRGERLAHHSRIVAEVARELARVGLRAGPVLEALARRVAEALQGGCVVTIQAEDTSALEVVATHHPSPEADALLRRTIEGAVGLAAGSPVSRAFEDAEAALFPAVSPELLESLVRARPALGPFYARYGLSSFVVAPLRVPGKVLGTIGCSRLAGAPPLDPDDLAFLSKLADLASLALENARLHSLTEDAAARSQVVAELSHAFASAEMPSVALLDQVARRLSEVLRGCVIVRLARPIGDGRHDDPSEPAAWHAPTDDARAALLRLAPTFGRFPQAPGARAAFGADGPLLLGSPGVEHLERLRAIGLDWLLEQDGVRTVMAAPLMSRGELVGIVAAWRGGDARPFVRRDAEFLRKIADVAALAVANLRLLRAAEADRAHLVAVLQQLPVGVAITDPSGRLVMANEQTGLVLGRTPVVGEAVIDADMIGAEGEGPLARALRSGEVVRDEEAELTRDDGTAGALRVSAAPVRDPDGRVVAGVLTLADVSDLARLERELRRRAEELADAHERKDQFLAMLAHELRAPLAPILTATHLLQHRGASPKALERAAGVIDRQVHHLARLVDDLLEVSRITRGKIRMERQVTDAAAVVARALETSRPAIQAKGHALEVVLAPERLPLEADPVRLSQVLSNLLQNAAKYTDAGGRITLRARREAHEVVFSVSDEGIGIPPDKLESIFELFAQVDRSLDRSQGGLGIGLTLARALVELHGGTIRACSHGVGRGAELTVRLPAYEPLSVLAAAPDDLDDLDGGPAARSRRVLVVDDSRDAVEMLVDLLNGWGHEVAVASDGVEALERAAAFVPEVVLLDIGLPRLDGYEVARRLRSARAEPAPLLVAVTGYGQEDDRRRAADAGFDGLLVKPVAVRDLREVIERGIKRRTSGRQRRSAP